MDKVSDRQGCLKDQVRTRLVRQACVDRKTSIRLLVYSRRCRVVIHSE